MHGAQTHYETELEQLNRLLYEERINDQFKRSLRKLDELKPIKPEQPSPPQRIAVRYDPIPYPSIIVPDFGIAPWYKASLISALVIVAYICISLLVLCTPLANSILQSPFTHSPIGVMNGVCILLAWFSIVSLLIGIVKKDTRPEKYIKRMESSPEFIRQCQEIDALNEEKRRHSQAETDQRYQQAWNHYRTHDMPEYNKEIQEYLNIYLPNWKELIQKTQQGIKLTEEKLASLYKESSLPSNCRNIDALEFIISNMETTHCDLQHAIANYDQKETRDLLHTTLTKTMEQTDDMQRTIQEQQELIDHLSNQVEDTHNSIRNEKRWNIAISALAGYAAYRIRKIGRQADKKERD